MNAEKILNILMETIKEEMKKQKVKKSEIGEICKWSKNTITAKFKNPRTILTLEMITIIEHLNILNPLYYNYKGGE